MTTPLRATRLPDLVRLRLSALTSGGLRAKVDDSALVFLGAPTGSPWASSLAVGEPTVLLSRTDAVALGAATLRAAPPRPTVPLQILLPLAILLVLVGALVAHVEPWVPAEAWIAVLPLTIVAAAGLLAALGVVMVPVPPLACAAMLGALAETLRLRSRMAGFFRRLGHRLAVTDSGVPREANPTPQAMLQQLASLTWNHLPTDRMLYVHRNGREAEVIGGFGLAADDVGVELSASRLRRLATAGRCDEIALDGRMAIAVVEVPRHGEAVGWWMVAWDQSDDGPTAERLADLARWVSDEAPVRPEVHPFARLLRTDRELDRLEQAFERSERASARQRLLLRTVRTPLAVADRAGTIVFQNAAFSALLGDAHPRSLRQLVYEAGGAVGLSRRMRDLFESGVPLEVAWADRGVRLRASPAADGARSGVLITVEPLRAVDAEDAPLAAK